MRYVPRHIYEYVDDGWYFLTHNDFESIGPFETCDAAEHAAFIHSKNFEELLYEEA